jgi:hypothetical protein
VGRHARALTGLIVPGCLLAACSFTSLDPLQSGSTTSAGPAGGASPATSTTDSVASSSAAVSASSTGGDGGAGGGATTTIASTSSSGGGGAGGDGGTGGTGGEAPLALVDTSLLVRYFIDEAPSGDGPSQLLDATMSPLPLSIDYPDDDGMRFVTEDEHIGLTWDAAGVLGKATHGIEGKLLTLDNAVHATIEVVARVDAASTLGSRLLHIGTDSESALTLAVSHPDELNPIDVPSRLEMRTRTTTKEGLVFRYAFFDADLSGGRTVIHAVYDSQRDDPLERIRIFQDGVLLTRQADGRPNAELNEDLFIDASQILVVGNRDNGQRSIEGTIFYAALYRAALDEEEIANNVEALLARDDR